MGIRRDPLDQLLVARGVPAEVIDAARLQAEASGLGLTESITRSENIDSGVLGRTIADTLGAILKYQDDIAKLQGSEAKRILDQAKASLDPSS